MTDAASARRLRKARRAGALPVSAANANASTRGRQAPRPKKFRSQLQVEEFEGRMLLSTLNITSLPLVNRTIATYRGDVNAPSVTLSESTKLINSILFAERIFTDGLRR
jgi:hypothetical protein